MRADRASALDILIFNATVRSNQYSHWAGQVNLTLAMMSWPRALEPYMEDQLRMTRE